MATNDTLVRFSPGESNFPAGSEAGSASVEGERVVSYPDDGDNAARFEGRMPNRYAGTVGVRVRISLDMAAAEAGDIDLLVAFDRRTGAQLRGRSFAAPVSRLNMVVPSTSGQEFVVNANFADGTAMDSVAAGDLFSLRVRRRGSTDEAAGDMHIHHIEIKER